MRIGNLLQDITSDNKVKGEGNVRGYQQTRLDNGDTVAPNQRFSQWSTKQQDEAQPEQLLFAQANQRRQSYNKAKLPTNARHVESDKAVHRSWGSVEGIETKTDDYLIAMREKAAIVIQKWYRRMKIRRTAGAAAVRRMMAAKKQEIEARMSYENEEV